MAKPTHIEIRMYGTGTGDCFILKFFNNDILIYTIMIDGGTWSGSKEHLDKYVKDLKQHVNNKVDLLVITHEHKDHVYLFDVCSDLLCEDFEVGELWMAWCENDEDPFVSKWKEEFGKKKMALAMSADKIKKGFSEENLKKQFKNNRNSANTLAGYHNFKEGFDSFMQLNFSLKDGVYAGGLTGMENIKTKVAKNKNIRYLKPGQIKSIDVLDGMKFNILGPPESITAIKKEDGKKGTGQTYDHNKVLRQSDSYALAVSGGSTSGDGAEDSIFPEGMVNTDAALANYYSTQNEWRQIDLDWLMVGAGNLALRLNSGINNLSLAMAMEVEDTGEVLLFPGDAEFGSWESWHTINWNKSRANGKHFTEDLLNRTVFYKVAHHLSHNGTAKEKGLNMMTAPGLVAMATLDFDAISSGWTTTMPNRAILRELITKTQGRLIVMNENKLFCDFQDKEPLHEAIENARTQMSASEQSAFKDNMVVEELYKQYTYRL